MLHKFTFLLLFLVACEQSISTSQTFWTALPRDHATCTLDPRRDGFFDKYLQAPCKPAIFEDVVRCVPSTWSLIGTLCNPTSATSFRLWASRKDACEAVVEPQVFISSEQHGCSEYHGHIWVAYDQPDQRIYLDTPGGCVPSNYSASAESHVFDAVSIGADTGLYYDVTSLADPALDACDAL